MIDLVVSDMDGTLLNGAHSISPKNIEAIRYLQNQGGTFAIATGRHYLEAIPSLVQNDIQCPIITTNGAAIYDENGELISLNALDTDTILHILTLAQPFPELLVEIFTIDTLLTVDLPRRQERMRLFIQRHIKDEKLTQEQIDQKVTELLNKFPTQEVTDFKTYLQEHTDTPLLKLFVTCGTAVDQLAAFKTELEQVDGISVTSSGPSNLEINAQTATKGQAVTQLAQRLNISLKNTLTIGDNLNDLSMITVAGVGVAMGNAHDTLKEVADFTTASVSDDGVAQAIYHFVQPNTTHDLSAIHSLKSVGKKVDKRASKLSWLYIVLTTIVVFTGVAIYRSISTTSRSNQEEILGSLSQMNQHIQSLENQIESLQQQVDEQQAQIESLQQNEQ